MLCKDYKELKAALVGTRLIRLDDKRFSVMGEDGAIRNFDFIEDNGDCCGYNELTTRLLIDKDDLKNAPVITNVKFKKRGGKEWESDAVTITFFGVSKPLAMIDSLSSSGSGWEYGATVSVTCRENSKYFCLTSW